MTQLYYYSIIQHDGTTSLHSYVSALIYWMYYLCLMAGEETTNLCRRERWVIKCIN